MMSLVGIGMVLALLADVLIVRRLGFDTANDALIIALTLPRLIGTVGRDATKFSLMTVFIQADREQGPEAFKRLGARVFTLFFGIGLLLMATGLILPGPIVSVIGFGLKPESQALSTQLLRLASGIAVFALGSAVLEVMLNSRKHFTVTALRNAITPIMVITATVMTWRDDERAVYWIAGAFTVGYGACFLLLWVNVITRVGLVALPVRPPDRATLRLLRGTSGPPLAGFGVRQLARAAERAIASMGPSGSVAAYYYAYRLLAAIQNLVGVSVALTGQPKLTEHDLAGDRDQFFKTLRRRALIALSFGVPAMVILMVFSTPIIELLYAGKRSGAGDGVDHVAQLMASAEVLWWLGPLAVFSCIVPVLTSALYAAGRYKAVLYNMTLAATVNVVLAWVLFNALGLKGIALAAVGASVFSMMNLSRLVSRTPAKATDTDKTT